MRTATLPVLLTTTLASAALLLPAGAEAATKRCPGKVTIFSSLTVSGTTCRQGLKVMKAFANSGSSTVLGYRITSRSKGESAEGAGNQYVTARRGSKVIRFVGRV